MHPDDLLISGPARSPHTFVFAHGAGAGMDHPFMEAVATGLAERGIRVVRFEFPYLRRSRELGKRRGPDRQPVLCAAFREAMELLGPPAALAIGGKSMGGRMATYVAGEVAVRRVVCFGYPFHPPGRPEKLRTEHLASLAVPTLILQGTRDPFGKPEEVAGYQLSPTIDVEWIPDGDHSFKPRKRSGHTLTDNLRLAVERTAAFVTSG